jgi:hypothetical protein
MKRPAPTAPKSNGTKTAKAPAAAKKRAPARSVFVDYPREDEVVLSAGYTIRIEAEDAASVELSLNGGEWLPCRESVGYWWFDWQPVPGSHELTARAKKLNGRSAKSDTRRFRVELT